jgi:trans-aconitate 2-methyltransferase
VPDSRTHEWDARAYDRVSGPQTRWAGPVLERLQLRGDERVLDAGCGTGRVSEQLLQRLPRGTLLALDADPAMVASARERLASYGPRVEYVVANLSEPLPVEPVDAVFSTAALHWVRDHDRLFANLSAALKPGGQLVAQFGGAGNVRTFLRVIEQMGLSDRVPWTFPTPEETRRRLEAAGFIDIDAWLQDEPTPFDTFDDMDAFIRTSCLGPWLKDMSAQEGESFAREVTSRIPKLELDYVRLNVVARKAVSSRP